MGRRRGVIYVHGPDYYCHCSDHAACAEVHAEDEDVPNDDVAAYFVWHEPDYGGNTYYHSLEDMMADLTDDKCGPLHVPGEGFVTLLATGETWDAAEFREAHL